ncbi:MAG: hypothetical protein Q9179_007826, partial [Wetmoreana sp. 5 TL-2023]
KVSDRWVEVQAPTAGDEHNNNPGLGGPPRTSLSQGNSKDYRAAERQIEMLRAVSHPGIYCTNPPASKEKQGAMSKTVSTTRPNNEVEVSGLMSVIVK